MLVVRKEGKAHDQYNSFRSAFELMEAVGREPNDSFNEMGNDLPPLEKLKQTLLAEIHGVRDENSELKAEIHGVKTKNSQLEIEIHAVKAENSQLKVEIDDLRCQVEKLLEHHT